MKQASFKFVSREMPEREKSCLLVCLVVGWLVGWFVVWLVDWLVNG